MIRSMILGLSSLKISLMAVTCLYLMSALLLCSQVWIASANADVGLCKFGKSKKLCVIDPSHVFNSLGAHNEVFDEFTTVGHNVEVIQPSSKIDASESFAVALDAIAYMVSVSIGARGLFDGLGGMGSAERRSNLLQSLGPDGKAELFSALVGNTLGSEKSKIFTPRAGRVPKSWRFRFSMDCLADSLGQPKAQGPVVSIKQGGSPLKQGILPLEQTTSPREQTGSLREQTSSPREAVSSRGSLRERRRSASSDDEYDGIRTPTPARPQLKKSVSFTLLTELTDEVSLERALRCVAEKTKIQESLTATPSSIGMSPTSSSSTRKKSELVAFPVFAEQSRSFLVVVVDLRKDSTIRLQPKVSRVVPQADSGPQSIGSMITALKENYVALEDEGLPIQAASTLFMFAFMTAAVLMKNGSR